MARSFYESRIQTGCLLIISTVCVAGALYWLRPILVPFVLSLFIAYGLLPVVEFQVRRFKFPRVAAVGTTLVFAGLFLGAMALIISTSVGQLRENADVYRQQFQVLTERISVALSLENDALLGPTFREYPFGTLSGVLLDTANAVLGLVSQGLLVFIFIVYLLIGGRRNPGPDRQTWEEIEKRIEHYIANKAVISLATGVLVGLILQLLGVQLALVFGLLAFLLNFIPNVGSIIATLLPLPVVVVSPEISGTSAGLAILLPGVLQVVIGNVIEPKVMGDALDLHPIVILMAMIFWGMLWGIVGMLLATPITAILKILFERIEPLEPVARLLAGRLD